MSSTRGPAFLAGALLGGLIGAGVTALLNPCSGERIREGLAAWRTPNRAEGEPGHAATHVFDASAALVEASLHRVRTAGDAARAASEDARRRLWQEWSARLAGVSDGQLGQDGGQSR